MIPALSPFTEQQALYTEFLKELHREFRGEIQSDINNRLTLATDNSIYQIMPQGVVFPQDTADLLTVMSLAAEERFRDVCLCARGGGTGTNGQSLTDGIVVDTSRHMNRVLEINTEEKWVRVECGVVKDQLNAALKPHGLFFAPELSTSNRATIGGMINTDASGQGSCVYGKTRDHVLALTTVLSDGSVLQSSALSEQQLESSCQGSDRSALIHREVADIYQQHETLIDDVFPPLNRCLTGYDLAHIRDQHGHFNLNSILCGSEGTLGFIAEAKLNLLEIPKYSALVLVKYADFNSSLRDATQLMRANPTSIETIDSKVLSLAMNDFIWHQVEAFFEQSDSEQVKGINLVEFTGNDEIYLQQCVDGLIDLLKENVAHAGNTPDFDADTFQPAGRLGCSVAWGNSAVKRIWAMRKRAVGLLGNAAGEARPVPFVEDTAVPPEHLADFILEFREILDSYNLEYGMFGHVDAGVLHVRPALDLKDPAQEDIAWEISDRVADLCLQYNGLLWGEHGKGVRSEYSPKFFGELYPQLQRIKSLFDPHNQLNPGKIATPDDSLELLKINEVPTRGQTDREVAVETWQQFPEAVFCNGNGACYNWDPSDTMCPSWKGTRDRIHSPKGRASLFKAWLKYLSDHKVNTKTELEPKFILSRAFSLPKKIVNSANPGSSSDFSKQVYAAMAGCLSCKACAAQCPIKVDVAEFRSKFLSLYHTRYLRPLKDYLVGTLEFVLPWCAKMPAAYNAVMSSSPVKSLLKNLVGFVDGPLLSKVSLKKNNIETADLRVIKRLSDENKANTVIIVQDAFTRYFETALIVDIFRFIESLGFKPYLAPFKANGKPLHIHGFLNSFKRVAKKNAQMLNAFSEQGIKLIGVDPSMTYTYRSEYLKALDNVEGENEEQCPAPSVLLIQEWLAEQLPLLKQNKPDTSKTYMLLPHCIEQSHATVERDQWKTIFEAFGQKLDIQSVGCCGMSGTYGHEARNKATSTRIYQLSWQKPVEQTSEGLLLATGYSCRSQVKREGNKLALHPLQALVRLQQKNTS